MVSIINERKNHANFQLIIITHDENFLRKLGQGDVMDYYWCVPPKLLIPILGFTHFTGGFLEIHDKNPSLRGRDSVKVPPIDIQPVPTLQNSSTFSAYLSQNSYHQIVVVIVISSSIATEGDCVD